MDVKKFFKVFCPLLLVMVMVMGVAAFTYDGLSVEIGADGQKIYKSEKSERATGVYNALLIGRDKGGMLTDTMMFVRVDNDKEEVNIISIPRDTYVSGLKLNSLYSIGGIEETIGCIEDIIGLKIDYYVSITTDVFRDIVDELGGVNFYVPQNMYYSDPYQDLYIDLQEGEQLLDGDKAEQLVRFRSYPEGDIQRTQVQRDFIQALITQKKSLKYINKVDDIYRGVADHVETNLKLKTILENIIMFKNLDVENNLNAYVLPNMPQYVGGASYVFVMEDKLTELLEDKFGVKKSQRNPRSGEYSYITYGISNQSEDYPDYEEYMEQQNGEVDTEDTDDFEDNESEGTESEDTESEEETTSDEVVEDDFGYEEPVISEPDSYDTVTEVQEDGIVDIVIG